MRQQIALNEGWEFRRCEDEAKWEVVSLPHSPVEADADGGNHWQGLCEYRRKLRAAAAEAGARQVLWVGGAMHTAVIQVDGRELGRHEGGYMSFEIDLTTVLTDGREHELVITLDNRDSADVPPGKPFRDLDFCWYGGLYRGVELRVYPSLHITDELSSGRVAGGGVFFRTLEASEAGARCVVAVEVANFQSSAQRFRVRAALADGGPEVASALTELCSVGAGAVASVQLELAWAAPSLWSVETPALHALTVTVVTEAGQPVDVRRLDVGVRRISFSRSGGFVLNGRRVRLRGTNRHQEYPTAGYAVGSAADRRDAVRIKEAGFDYVRLSHYPQSPAFLEACDRLGIVVMNAIPGWQFIGGAQFRDACERNARELVRRDRNHACVVLWELSLNETQMDEAFIARLHQAGHEEYPGDQMFTCGWKEGYDVYVHARQHGGIHSWSDGDRAHVVSEYGDWEYYAANEGFDQTTGAGVHAAWSNSRHRRGEGERALLQQAYNFTVALNDTLSSPAVLDGQWCVFDYARGYHPQRAACGVSDAFRVPKYAWHFYRSQRDPKEGGEGWRGGAEVFIASNWRPDSSLRVTVFGNCEEVELQLNGRRVGRSKPAVTKVTQFLPHPPFIFDLPGYEAGELKAVGYCGGVAVAEHRVRTALAPAGILVCIDNQGVRAERGAVDVVVVNARLVDGQGATCVAESGLLRFTARAGGRVVGNPVVAVEAGIASVLVRIEPGAERVLIEAETASLKAVGEYTR